MSNQSTVSMKEHVLCIIKLVHTKKGDFFPWSSSIPFRIGSALL